MLVCVQDFSKERGSHGCPLARFSAGVLASNKHQRGIGIAVFSFGGHSILGKKSEKMPIIKKYI